MTVKLLVSAATVATFALAPLAYAAGDGPTGPSSAVKFEEIQGTHVKKVILTEKAVERLGVELGEIGTQEILLTQMVGGRVVPPVVDEAPDQRLTGGTFGAAASVQQASVQQVATAPELPDLTEAWVLVTLSPDEWARVKQDKSGRLLQLETRDDFASELVAEPTGLDPLEDPKRTMLNVFYKVPTQDHGLFLNQRVRVELEITGPDGEQMVTPYGSVYYDGEGQAWVYTNPEPLVYVREPIEVERIVGDMAVLSAGPPVGRTIKLGKPEA